MGANREDTIRTLYAAATGVGSWPEALDGLATLGRSQVVTLDTYDLEAHAGKVLAANVIPDPAIEDYNREFGRGNFQIEAGRRYYRAGNVLRTSDFISQRDLLESDLYQNVYRPMGIRCASGVALEVTPSKIVEFSFMKGIDAGDHSNRNIERIRQLVPHMQQAWAGYSHLQALESSLATLTDLWDEFNHAVMVIDRRMQLKFANRAAEALFANGSDWCVQHGFLRRRNDKGQAMLGRALHELASGEQAIFSLAKAGDPAGGSVATLFQIDDERTALILTDRALSTTDFRAGLRTCFVLTLTESELISALLSGDSLRQFADSRQVCYETARTHLKNAMGKNGWRRQTEMITSVLRRLLPLGVHSQDG